MSDVVTSVAGPYGASRLTCITATDQFVELVSEGGRVVEYFRAVSAR